MDRLVALETYQNIYHKFPTMAIAGGPDSPGIRLSSMPGLCYGWSVMKCFLFQVEKSSFKGLRVGRVEQVQCP